MSSVASITHARRVVSWGNTRWDWKRAVRQDERLSDAAKVLAATLCDDFANHGTGFCNPSVAALARGLGKSERSIQRAISALKAAGWIDTIVRGRGDRGSAGKNDQGSEFIFLMAARDCSPEPEKAPDPATEKVADMAPLRNAERAQRVTPAAVKGDTRVVSPCTPYKDKPILNQRARAGDRSARMVITAADGQRDRCASPQAGEAGVTRFWAEKIRVGAYVPPSAIPIRMVQTMLTQALVTESQLRSAGVGW